MRIQHNIAAINSHRQLMGNNNAVGKNLEKLSSGYRINRAGDDAAGLAISEKMRAQITGLETAQKNANDGISLVQTAEGALTEVHSMLNRMVELADQSANGTYQDKVDRENLQKELNSLRDEIDRISEGTNFNGINLLDGSLGAKTGAGKVNTITDSGTPTALTASTGTAFTQTITLGSTTSTSVDQTLSFKYLDKNGDTKETSITFNCGTDQTEQTKNATAELQKLFGDSYKVDGSTAGTIKITANSVGEDKTEIINGSISHTENGKTITTTVGSATAGKDQEFVVDVASVVTDVTKRNFLEIDGEKFQILTRGQKAETGAKAIYLDQTTASASADSAIQIAAQLKDYGVNAYVDPNGNGTKINIVKADAHSNAKGGLTLQIGDTADDFNQLKVVVGNMSADALGIAGVDISNQAGAKAAVKVLKDAINQVSSTRGDLGANQNRLEHTINNLGVTTENMTAAESRIRDVDMAKEMMNYTKNNILVQASQAMLAQANQQPQGVLQLLQ